MRDGERPRAPELRLRARAPLPATVVRCDSAVQEHARLRTVEAYAPAGADEHFSKNGVDSPYGESHRKDPQVAGDREDDLTVLTPQTA